MIRVVIIDDEPLAIDALRIILEKNCQGKVEVVASSHSPHDGRELILKYSPDLVFVDIEMPGMNGIELIRSIKNPNFRVVFVTAFESYAIDALRLSAMEYLLKPVEADEIERIVDKAKIGIPETEAALDARMQKFESFITANAGIGSSKIAISMADKIVFVAVSEIMYCAAEGAYTHVFMTNGPKIVATRSLGDFEGHLANKGFFRIHHSCLVNLRI